jgi:hypothetical protein
VVPCTIECPPPPVPQIRTQAFPSEGQRQDAEEAAIRQLLEGLRSHHRLQVMGLALTIWREQALLPTSSPGSARGRQPSSDGDASSDYSSIVEAPAGGAGWRAGGGGCHSRDGSGGVRRVVCEDAGQQCQGAAAGGPTRSPVQYEELKARVRQQLLGA